MVDPATVLFARSAPSLAARSHSKSVLDPTLDLIKTQGGRLATDDNWKEAEQGAIEATGLVPSKRAEAAPLVDLNPGSSTAVFCGAGAQPASP